MNHQSASAPAAASAESRSFAARDLAYIGIFAALIAALGVPSAINIGTSSVPITFQTLGVMLAGAILGPKRGTAAVAVFLGLAAAGLPILSGGRGGLVWFTTAPSAGYAWGFLLGAFIIGYGTIKLLPKYRLIPAFFVTALGGIVAIYAVGIPVTVLNTGLPWWGAIVDATKFLPGDILKVAVTVVVAQQVHRALPGVLVNRVTRGPTH